MTTAPGAGGPSVEFVGLRFAQVPMARVLGWLAARDEHARFAYVVTPNVDHIVRFARAADRIRRTYLTADLCVCDSRVLARIARWYGIRLPVVPGSDLTRLALADVFAPGDRLCLVGGASGMAAALEALHPGLTVIQHLAPMGLLGDAAAREAAITAAATTRARAVLIAVGSPQQELLAWEMRQSGRVTGTALCIGASIDFILGTQSRAPLIVQRAGLEWAWRLVSQPRRLWRRYLIDGPAIFGLARAWARSRREHRS